MSLITAKPAWLSAKERQTRCCCCSCALAIKKPPMVSRAKSLIPVARQEELESPTS